MIRLQVEHNVSPNASNIANDEVVRKVKHKRGEAKNKKIMCFFASKLRNTI